MLAKDCKKVHDVVFSGVILQHETFQERGADYKVSFCF
jgi:hypothetical protein